MRSHTYADSARCPVLLMRLTAKNARYDASSGAFIVQQSDEMKLLTQIGKRLERMEKKLDALMQGSVITDGKQVGNQ